MDESNYRTDIANNMYDLEEFDQDYYAEYDPTSGKTIYIKDRIIDTPYASLPMLFISSNEEELTDFDIDWHRIRDYMSKTFPEFLFVDIQKNILEVVWNDEKFGYLTKEELSILMDTILSRDEFKAGKFKCEIEGY